MKSAKLTRSFFATILKQACGTMAMAALFLVGVNSRAASFSELYSFTTTSGIPAYTNSDGAEPVGGLLLSGNTLYGTTPMGGASNFGTVFRVNTDGTAFTNIHTFNGNSGKGPNAGLVLIGNTLYGTAAGAGSGSAGTVFAVNTDGTGFTNLYGFIAGSWGGPSGGLTLSGGQLYGTTTFGGSLAAGTVFRINPDGTGFTNIFNFSSANGYSPYATLVSSGNTLYGTAVSGGSSSAGTVFRLNDDGTAYTNLHSFTATVSGTNSDGKAPYGHLALSGNRLYGTTRNGGAWTAGTLFALNTDGTGFTNLHSFSRTSASLPATNTDGSVPYAGLIVSGNTLYGAAGFGGPGGSGTIFQINLDGTGFATLHQFTVATYNNNLGVSTNTDGAYPYGTLLLSGNTLYGTTQQGTSGGSGSVFALTLVSGPAPIALSIQLVGGAAVLTWTDPVAAFSLQAAPDVSGLYTNVPGASSPFTHTITDSRTFFRLHSN